MALFIASTLAKISVFTNARSAGISTSLLSVIARTSVRVDVAIRIEIPGLITDDICEEVPARRKRCWRTARIRLSRSSICARRRHEATAAHMPSPRVSATASNPTRRGSTNFDTCNFKAIRSSPTAAARSYRDTCHASVSVRTNASTTLPDCPSAEYACMLTIALWIPKIACVAILPTAKDAATAEPRMMLSTATCMNAFAILCLSKERAAACGPAIALTACRTGSAGCSGCTGARIFSPEEYASAAARTNSCFSKIRRSSRSTYCTFFSSCFCCSAI